MCIRMQSTREEGDVQQNKSLISCPMHIREIIKEHALLMAKEYGCNLKIEVNVDNLKKDVKINVTVFDM